MAIDILKLREPITGDDPCGPDLGDTPEVGGLDVLVRGKPGVQYGSFVQPAEEPDWADVEEQCAAVLTRSKDLRALTYLTVALLRRHGYAGLRDGLGLLRHTLENFWEGVYPRLDPDDQNDPMQRRNILESLAPPPDAVDQFLQMKERVLDAPLCESRRFGKIGLRQVLWAAGELTAPAVTDANPPDAGIVQGAFDDAEPAALERQAQAIGEAAGHIRAIDVRLQQVVAGFVAPSLAELGQWVERAEKEVAGQIARRGIGAVPAAGADAAASAVSDGAVRAAAAPAAGPGSIQSADDVLKALDLIGAFYQKHEPSSPLPLLLLRARRLVGKSFTEIIQDLSPDAMRQIEVITGAVADGAKEPG